MDTFILYALNTCWKILCALLSASENKFQWLQRKSTLKAESNKSWVATLDVQHMQEAKSYHLTGASYPKYQRLQHSLVSVSLLFHVSSWLITGSKGVSTNIKSNEHRHSMQHTAPAIWVWFWHHVLFLWGLHSFM